MSRTLGVILLTAFPLSLTGGDALAQKRHPVSEVFVGILHHDTGVFGNSKEEGPDGNIEWRFDPPELGLWQLMFSPRPTIGLNVNSQGDTSALYVAGTWTAEFWGGFFFDWSMGGALHDGETSGDFLDRKALGSRVLFYLAAGIGFRFWEHHAISLRLDHMSNASLADDNDGLDTVGIRYSYKF